LQKLKKKLLAICNAQGNACRALACARKTKRDAVLTLRSYNEAQAIVQSLAQQLQDAAHTQISDIVTDCLSAVFEEPYTFVIHMDKKRGKTEAVMRFLRDGLEVDPMAAAGGGVVDVAAFALRIACLTLAKPKLRPLLVLDEPFRFVSAEYRENVRNLILALSKDLEIQFVMVTHIRELQCGKVVHLQK
jgi:DNA repair exonuclease SbcCD ATPase subunit